jgi:hypothetical protein
LREEKIGYTGLERRKLTRLSSPLPVRFCVVPIHGDEFRSETVVGRIRDISAGGLCLETNTVIIKRTHILSEAMGGDKNLLLAIEIPDGENPLEVSGTVIWYDLAPDDSDYRFRAGVLFTKMGEEIKKRWKNYLSAIRKRRMF